MSGPEGINNSITKAEWGEHVDDFATRVYQKYLLDRRPFTASVGKIIFIVDGTRSPEQIVSLIKKKQEIDQAERDKDL